MPHTFYVSSETRARMNAAIDARTRLYKRDFRTLGSILEAALEWFFAAASQDLQGHAQPDYSLLQENLGGTKPYNRAFSANVTPQLLSFHQDLPPQMKSQITDKVVATWLVQELPRL